VVELRRVSGRATDRQKNIAASVGVDLDDDLPESVAAAVLAEALSEPLNLELSPPVTPNQVAYVSDLASGVGRTAPDHLASARHVDGWLPVLFAERAIQALEQLRPEPGDVVQDLDGRNPPGVVNSISADGRVNFVGGAGAGARPHRLRIVARAGEEGEHARTARREAANVAAQRRNRYLEQPPAGPKLKQLERWIVKGRVERADLLQFEEILDSAADEKPIQRFLEEHPEMLASLLGGTYANAVVPRIDLGGKLEPDFLFAEVDSAGVHWWLIELESPRAQVLLQDGELAEKARHAIKQIEDWRRWLTNNLDEARRLPYQDGVGLVDIRREHTRGLVLIGRREEVLGCSEDARQRESTQSRILVRTYDWLLQKFRLGPAPGIQAHLPSEYRLAERAVTEDELYVGVDFDALLEETDELELDALLDED
jgi:hypothetical protein